MSFSGDIKKLAGFKYVTTGDGKKYDVDDLVLLITNSRDKKEIGMAVTLFLAVAKVSLKKGKEKEAQALMAGIMHLVSKRNDDVFNLEDVRELIVNADLKDAADKISGTPL
ncbi:MAG: hypothetical protein LBL07_03660 [Tannerella sp.]|jgi:hypothetical protein|nr:hypothetical protein [Tannerella sp.]